MSFFNSQTKVYQHILLVAEEVIKHKSNNPWLAICKSEWYHS